MNPKKGSNTINQTISSAIIEISILLACIWIYIHTAIQKPFFGGSDLVSNLLPIVHYRYSILQEHTLPLNTQLWYGGRPQWMNPLWSFCYLPATLIWLALPLHWGARVVLGGHLLAAVMVGWYFVRRLLPGTPERLLAALLLVSPITVTPMLGHIEKLLAWPWVLLGLQVLLRTDVKPRRQGLIAGISLSMIALAGSNYYVLYTLVLYGTLLVANRSRPLLAGFGRGSLLGLLHVPSVVYLVGVARGDKQDSSAYIITWKQAFEALFLGPINTPAIHESFALIGVASGIALVVFGTQAALVRRFPRPALAMLVATLIALMLATATLYQGHPLLDTFRITSRAMAFAALALTTALLLCAQANPASKQPRWSRPVLIILLVLAVGQAAPVWWHVRPQGSEDWLDNSGATRLAMDLQQQQTRSLWISKSTPQDELVYLAVNEHGISLPNAYFGHMGQTITASGDICGYSFEKLLSEWPPQFQQAFHLRTDTWPPIPVATIAYDNFTFTKEYIIGNKTRYVYTVVCKDNPLSNQQP